MNDFKEQDGSSTSEISHNRTRDYMLKAEPFPALAPERVDDLLNHLLTSEILGHVRPVSDALETQIRSLQQDLSTLQMLETVLGQRRRAAAKQLIGLMAGSYSARLPVASHPMGT